MTPPEGGQSAVVLKAWLKAGKIPCKHKERGEEKGRVERGERVEREEGRRGERDRKGGRGSIWAGDTPDCGLVSPYQASPFSTPCFITVLASFLLQSLEQ